MVQSENSSREIISNRFNNGKFVRRFSDRGKKAEVALVQNKATKTNDTPKCKWSK